VYTPGSKGTPGQHRHAVRRLVLGPDADLDEERVIGVDATGRDEGADRTLDPRGRTDRCEVLGIE
jgi:hypothetical protein